MTADLVNEENGKFGRAFNPCLRTPLGAEAEDNPEYQDMPITVECWVKLNCGKEPNVVLACGYESPGWGLMTNHWRIMSQAETGFLMVYLQGSDPSWIKTRTIIADMKWHYLAMTYDKRQVRTDMTAQDDTGPHFTTFHNVDLHVDTTHVGTFELRPAVTLNGGERLISEGPLMFGHYRPNNLQCDGLIDEVRISSVVRNIRGTPNAPFELDHSTVGLWHFDEYDEEHHRFNDLSGADNHAVVKPVGNTLDEHDRMEYGVLTSPFDRQLDPVSWKGVDALEVDGADDHSLSAGAEEMMLHGAWECIQVPSHGRSVHLMCKDEHWKDAFPANVPCTVQTALFEAGRIKDPMVLTNSHDIQWVSEREWWLRKEFTVPEHWRGRNMTLLFDGVDYRGTFWLNGCRLGQHEGMWGGPDFDVVKHLHYGAEKNMLMVRLDPAPPNYQDTFKNNVAYGWHYVKLITLGIWRSVRLQMRGTAEMQSPFMKTAELKNNGAQVQLSLDIQHWGHEDKTFQFECTLTPKNFDGQAYQLTRDVMVRPGANAFGFEGVLEGVRLWWPVDMGDQNLYQLQCILKDGDEVLDRYRCNWGARTIEMAPIKGVQHRDLYDWQTVVNGRKIWIKGANWCLPDALLRLDRQRLERFFELARHAHVQMIRVWGGGPIENDVLYDLCDEYGIMVQQEFSMLGFHRLQNMSSIHACDMTYYTVRRLRNRPSLALWAGANEILGQGRIVSVLGRRVIEVDGSRPFRRSCPYGGDTHYHIYWTQEPLVYHHELVKTPVAFTEFGMSSPANWETWKRILPESEWQEWPPKQDAVLVEHTPTFDHRHVELMERFAREYLEPKDLPSLIKGMQIAQLVADKFLIEGMRARKPETTMTHVYKLTENYPGASWSTIDYYGVPKMSHYGLRHDYEPVHVMATFDAWDSTDGELAARIHAVNDTAEPVDGTVEVTLFDGNLKPVKTDSFKVTVPTDKAIPVTDAKFELPAKCERPLFLLLNMIDGRGGTIDRNWYFFDFVDSQGCLFTRPRTTLTAELRGNGGQSVIHVTNTGALPALSVEFDAGAASNTYYFEDSCFWLNAGEERAVAVYKTRAVDGETREPDAIMVSAWNADMVVLR